MARIGGKRPLLLLLLLLLVVVLLLAATEEGIEAFDCSVFDTHQVGIF